MNQEEESEKVRHKKVDRARRLLSAPNRHGDRQDRYYCWRHGETCPDHHWKCDKHDREVCHSLQKIVALRLARIPMHEISSEMRGSDTVHHIHEAGQHTK